MIGTIIKTALLTFAGTILVMNLWSGESLIQHEVDASYGTNDPQFRQSMSHLLRAPLVAGNRVETLLNGESLTAMLDAIRSARTSITFETYIFWSGDVGARFVEAFAERARAGVPVHVIIDWVGSSDLDTEAIRKMEDAGVKLVRFRPPAWYQLNRLNNRTHRKILVIDGRVGFIGGVGIADHWRGDAGSPDHWRDTHFRVEGPVVAQMQTAFMDNWFKTGKPVLHGHRYFPPLEAVGKVSAQVVESSAEEESESLRIAYLLSIVAARERILIANAYFVPDDQTVDALVEAQLRGVNVEILVPGHIMDIDVVRQASRARWGPLLEAGIAIYEYQPTMYHCKVMVVDDSWVLVGSANFDERSFILNDEANMNVWDSSFAAEQTAIFERDKDHARRVTLEAWQSRPAIEKALDALSSLLGPQL